MNRFFHLLLLFVVTVFPACREQPKEELFQQGMAFVETGNHQAAITLFKDALDKDPNYIDVRMQLGIAYLETGKIDKAESELEKVNRQDPDNNIVLLRLAEIYLKTKRPDQAIKLLDTLQNSDPDNAEALRILAESKAMNGDLVAAEDLFRKALLIRPDNPPTQLGFARLFYLTKRTDEGDKLVNQVIEKHPNNIAAYSFRLRKALYDGDRDSAIVSLKKIKSINPDDIYASYMLGMLYLDKAKIGAAHEIAADLLTRKPNHPAGYRVDGVALYQSGDFKAAIETLQKSINGMPDLAGFYFLGLANYRFGQMEQALSNFQKALDKSPNHEPSRLMVAQTMLKKGLIEDSIRQAKLVIEKNPSNANAYNILGSAYLLQRKYDSAMESMDKAIQLNPDLAQAHFKKGLFNLAKGEKKQGELDLSNAVSAAPEILNTRLLLVSYHLRQQNYPMALQLINKGLTISPDSAILYNLKAAVMFGQNKPEEALKFLKKAKTLKSDYFTPYYNIANYHANRRNYKAALLEYLAVLQVDPTNVLAMLRSASLYELLDQDDQALSYYKKAANAQSPQGYLALASFQHRKGQKDAARETLKSGHTTIPDNIDLTIAYAEMFKAAGQYDEAILLYAHLEEIRPGTGKPLMLGIHLLKEDFAAAQEIAEQAISENPASVQGYMFKSAIYEKRSEWELAEKTMQKGILATEGDLTLKINQARLYTKRGDQDKALRLYDEILLEKPGSVPVLFAKAAIYDVTGDKKQAQSLYETILDTNESYVPALNNLAFLLLDVYADNERALELATKGFRLKPNNPRIMDTLGYALLKNGQIKKSIVFLEKATSLMPQEATIYLHLAQAYKAAGRKDDAVKSLAAINESNAHEAQIKEAKTLLSEIN